MAVAIVTRKSTRDEQQISVSRQEKMGRAWAKANRPGEPVMVFSDNATSGVKMDRPGWQAFAAAVRKGQISTVWAYEQSRLTRAGSDTWDDVCVMLWTARIREVNTQRQGSISVMEGNRLTGRLLAVIDQEEREVAKVRVTDTIKEYADEGRTHGRPGYGYRKALGDDGRPTREPDPDTAPIAARMVEEVARGDSLGTIADRLNRDRVPTPHSAKAWDRQAVRAIVTAPRLVGIRSHRGRHIPAAWEPIVDRATWERAQQILSAPHNGQRRVHRRLTTGRRRYLLTGGLAVCAHCNTPLISARQNGQPAYACPHPSRPDGGCGKCNILADRLEDFVVGEVQGWMDDPEALAALARSLNTDAEEVAPLRSELAEVEGSLASLAAKWAADDLTDIEYAAARRVFAERHADLTARLAEHRGPDGVTIEELLAAWREGTTDDRRGVIAALCQPISVARTFRDGRRLNVEQRATVEKR